MSDNGEIRSQISFSDNDSAGDTASHGSRISDDSGIEDWGEDMAYLMDQPEVNVTQNPKDEKPNSPKQLNSPNSVKEEATCNNECILPMLPMLPEKSAEPKSTERKDVLDASAINGVCGIYNIGNTCFMNAVLQSMIATQAIQKLVLQGDILQNGTDHMNEPSVVLLFIERFQELLQKVFSGSYSLLYPDQFHAAVRRLHTSFGDFKQHDSQEFLSFILNTLHDLLNHASNQNRSRQILSSTTSDHHAACISCKDSLSNDMMLEVSKKLKMDSSVDEQVVMESETDAGVECEDNVLKYEKAWREYICNNQSIIADTFQGQFQSLITCDKCLFISTTYEPFMFLSLPIPHAMERQIVVTWVPSMSPCTLPGMSVVKKYLVAVNKNGCISDVKKKFFELLKKEDESIICTNIVLAEVSSCASVKILDDRTRLNYLSKSKDVYGMEMLTVNTNNASDSDIMHENSSSAWHSCSICFEEVFDEQLTVHSICGGLICNDCLKRAADFHNGKPFQCPTCGRVISNDDYKPLINDKPNDTNAGNSGEFDMPSNVPSSSLGDDSTIGLSGASSWHSCAICLEDTFDEDLKVHRSCGGFLCAGCLMRTVEFHKNESFPCPVCDRYINADDYEAYVTPSHSTSGKSKRTLRQLLVPIMFRHSSNVTSSTAKKHQLFGHPTVCSLPSEVASTTVLELVHRTLTPLSSYPLNFDVVLSDGTGLSCGQCEMLSSCEGCSIRAMDVVNLRPGSCITVHFHDKTDVVAKILNLFHCDDSMNLLRDSDTVSLNECMEKFGDTEVLSDENPWYCPQCQTNQISTKNMTVTKWPDVLIIQLKRFYFEGTQGCKILCPVSYPLKDLNVDLLTCADVSESTKIRYDLYSVVCHTGTLFGGHYTSFTKRSASSKWYFFNDESYCEMTPSEEHHQEAYMLFYQRSSTKQVGLADDK